MKAKPKMPAEIRAFFVRQGRIGGKKGVTARMEKVSPERRLEIAKKAIAARWSKTGPKSG